MKTNSNPSKLAFLLILLITATLSAAGQNNDKHHGPPSWAPAHGYRADTRHVYFPDQNMYFDVQRNNYIYFHDGKWQVSVKLPSLYVGVDLGRAAKIELNLNTDSPQRYNEEHKTKYKSKHNEGHGNSNKENHGNGKGKKK